MLRAVRLSLRLTPKFSPELDRLVVALDALVDTPQVLERLLQQAVADTVLKSWRERFLAELPHAINMERPATQKAATSGPALDQARTTLTKASEALTQAQIDGKAVTGLKGKLTKATGALTKALEPVGGTGELATGQFRPLALQVLRAMSEVAVDAEADRITVGLGNRAALEAIKTPSATPMLTGHATTSALDTMWKHLEFGTGVYASNKSANPGGHTKMGTGNWWYGPRKGFGVQLKGSRGVHAMIDPGTGLPYMKDAIQFEDVFAAMFTAALSGH